MGIVDEIINAKRVAAPFIAVRSPDQNNTYRTICQTIKKDLPIVIWNCNSGIEGVNEFGKERVVRFMAAMGTEDAELAQGILKQFDKLLMVAAKVTDLAKTPKDDTSPEDLMLLICLNAQKHFNEPEQIQGLLSLRDKFAKVNSTLILLGPDFNFPPEVRQDIFIIDEELPTTEEIKEAVSKLYISQGVIKDKTNPIITTASQALRGLPMFTIEQAASLALKSTNGKFTVRSEDLWKRKREMINSIPGLKMENWGPTFDDIGGLASIKQFFAELFAGPYPPWVIVFIDEIEKALAGSSTKMGDTSGVSQDAVKMLLTSIEDYKWRGQIGAGPPGTAKTFLAQCLASTYQRPMISLDLGAAKGGIVGQSEQRIRDVMRTLYAIGGMGGCYFIATCLEENTQTVCYDGSLRPLKDAINEELVSLDTKNGEIIKDIAIYKQFSEKEVFLVELNGSIIECTKDHKFFDEHLEEIPLANLKEGSFIASPLQLPHGSGHINEDLAYLIGYTVGDGNLQRYRIQWKEESEEQTKRISSICKEFFGKEASYCFREKDGAYYIYLDGIDNVNKFADICPELKIVGSHRKLCPTAISSSDSSTVKNFLSGLFDADGTVTNNTIELCSVSKDLIIQVGMLLQRFDISGTIICGWKKKPNPYFKIVLAGRQAVLFTSLIGFRLKYKQDRALKIKEPSDITYNNDCIPIDWDWIDEIGCPINQFFGRNKTITIPRDRLVSIVKQLRYHNYNVQYLEQILLFRWQRIKRITPLGVKGVIDITLPQKHNFVAANLLTHNCNKLDVITPEMKRRFGFGGIWFFDLPVAEERQSIGKLQTKAFGLEDNPALWASLRGYSGANIRDACRLARDLQIPLDRAVTRVISAMATDAEGIKQLRTLARGKFLSASYEGPYTGEEETIPMQEETSGRKFKAELN